MRYIRSEKALATPVDDELVMFDGESGKYYGLNDVATAIWERLAQPHTVDELVESLTAEFDVAPERCREELETFIAHLLQRGLIEKL